MVKVHCRLPQKYLGRIDPTDTIITPHSPAGWIDQDSETAQTEPDGPASETLGVDVTSGLQPTIPMVPPPTIESESTATVETDLPLDDAI